MPKELEYIVKARKAAAEYVNDLLTLDRNASYLKPEDFEIKMCLWTTKDWSVVFTCEEKIPGDRVFVDYDKNHDEIMIEVVGPKEEASGEAA